MCIAGAGPAGLTIASELAGSGMQVVLLESGGRESDPRSQRLNGAEVVGAYGDVAGMRHRQLGGTANIWNTEIGTARAAKYLPLDRVDFLERRWRAASWPFGRDELDPYYLRAQYLAQLGPLRYDASAWASAQRAPLELNSDSLTSAVYQIGRAAPFLDRLPRVLASASNVRLMTNTTVVELEMDADRVSFARVVAGDQSEFKVRARRFVVAGGAIENARLLLASSSRRTEGAGGSSGWLGRGFMEHPRDFALMLTPARREFFEEAAFYDMHAHPGDAWVMGRLALQEDMLPDSNLPNASVTLLAALPATSGSRLARFRRLLGGRKHAYPRGGMGWSHDPAWRGACEGFRLLVNLEQAPDPDNRIMLADSRDALGMRKARVHWRWKPDEQAGLERLRALIVRELEGAGLGKVHCTPGALPNPNAHHHAGTVRMHADPREGVVDADCRVHDVENLYCAGAAVFPTAGFANPMLTIIALACRLADHLSGVSREPERAGRRFTPATVS